MKSIIYIAIFLLPFLGFSQERKTGKIILRIEGIETSEGSVMVAVYADAATFGSTDKVFAGRTYKATPGSIIVVFDSIPEGQYALSSFHDKNNNAILDKNRLGVPIEKFGFSNNVMGTFGPPSFEQAKISVVAGKSQMHTLRLRKLI